MGRRDAAAAWFALTAAELAALAAVHVTTARRWLRQGAAPHRVERSLAYLRAGDLSALSPAWSGWQLRCGVLVSPEGCEFTPGEVRAAPLERALARELRRELRAATDALLSAPERRELRAALVAAHNALAAAATACVQLGAYLTEPEAARVFEGLESTQEARARLGLSAEESREEPPPRRALQKWAGVLEVKR